MSFKNFNCNFYKSMSSHLQNRDLAWSRTPIHFCTSIHFLSTTHFTELGQSRFLENYLIYRLNARVGGTSTIEKTAGTASCRYWGNGCRPNTGMQGSLTPVTAPRRTPDENIPPFLFRWSPSLAFGRSRLCDATTPSASHLSTSTARNGVRGAVQVHAPAWIRNSPSPHTLLSPLAIIRSVPCRLSATPNPPPSRFRPENLLNSVSSFAG